MTSCARRWISGLPRCTLSKSSAAVLLPAAMRAGRAAAHADAHARPAQLHQQRAGAKGQLVTSASLMRPARRRS
jgi:hypothetical protein